MPDSIKKEDGIKSQPVDLRFSDSVKGGCQYFDEVCVF